jgi:hypothetical protein
MVLAGRARPIRFLVRDRDAKFTANTDSPPPSARSRPRRVRRSLQLPSATPLTRSGGTAHHVTGAVADLASRCNAATKIRPARWSHPRVQTGCISASDDIFGTHTW